MADFSSQQLRLPAWLRIVLGAQAGLVAGLLLGYSVLFDGDPATRIRTFWGFLLASSAAGAGFAYFDYRLRVRAGRPYSPRQLALSAAFAVGGAGALASALAGIGTQRVIAGWAVGVAAAVFALATYREKARWNLRPATRMPWVLADGPPEIWTGDIGSLVDSATTVILFVPYAGAITVGNLEFIGPDRWTGTVVEAGPGSTSVLLGRQVTFLERHVYQATLRPRAVGSDD